MVCAHVDVETPWPRDLFKFARWSGSPSYVVKTAHGFEHGGQRHSACFSA